MTEEELLISPRDLGLVRGYAVSDFIVTFHNNPHKVSEHIDRLFKSAEIYGITIPWSKEQISTWVQETFDKNDKESEKTMKIILSGGISNSMYQAQTPTLVMIMNHYVDKPRSYYENGVKAKLVRYKRPYAEAKHTHHVETIKQLAISKKDGVTEIIYYDDSQVFEAGGSCLFAVIDNKLVTTKSNIVEGLIRNTLLEILHLDIPIEERNFTLKELLKATEIFITNSRNGSIGVVELDGKPVRDGKIGEITKEVSRQYETYIQLLK